MTTLITGETWGDETDSVRAFLLDEANKPFPGLRPSVEAARRELLAALAGVTTEQAQFRPLTGEGEDAWGIAEVLRHIASNEAIMAERIRQLANGLPLALPATYPGYMEDVTTRELSELVEAIAQTRQKLLATVDAVDGQERLDTFDTHRRFGAQNCRGWFMIQSLHERDHARQIEKLKRMSGFPG